MTVWLHKETGNFVLAWQAYAMWSESREQIKLQCPVFVGWAVENKHGITCLFGEKWLRDFECLGPL